MHGSPTKNEYQVLARRYRPKSFHEVLGQDAIVTTLKNGMKHNRLAHAYLFSGPRGTGKTTLARLLAKAINCKNPSSSNDPCNICSSCREIGVGTSLDVIEIDGASNRGIDDIRQINETVGYSTSAGNYKIYIIDEVHMLTKEAFNALLKTLEEPPPTVKFFFATTEPHKVPPTVLSRCQHFHLRHLKTSLIAQKLNTIIKDQNREVDPEALILIATRAEGGLRDAESLLDQLLSFYEGSISASEAAEALGLLPQDAFFKLDQAGKEGNLAFAFEIAEQLFNEGKDPARFIDTLIEHFRRLLLIKLAGINSTCLEITDSLKDAYKKAADIYQKNQLLSILELCIDSAGPLRLSSSPRIYLEGLLLKILRSFTKIPLDQLVERLIDLEKRIDPQNEEPSQKVSPVEEPKAPIKPPSSINEDPTPKASDLPRKAKPTPPPPPPPPPTTPSSVPAAVFTPRHDTLLQFAAIELEGKIIKK